MSAASRSRSRHVGGIATMTSMPMLSVVPKASTSLGRAAGCRASVALWSSDAKTR